MSPGLSILRNRSIILHVHFPVPQPFDTKNKVMSIHYLPGDWSHTLWGHLCLPGLAIFATHTLVPDFPTESFSCANQGDRVVLGSFWW